MTKTISKTFSWMIGAIILVAGFAVSVQPVHAATTLNSASNDCPTAMVANHTTQAGVSNPCWGTSVSATYGETVNVRAYYHNNGFETARNVRIRLVPSTTGSARTHTFTAYISADNAATVQGTVSVTLPTSMALDYDKTVWAPNQVFTGIPVNGSMLNTNGFYVGNVTPGWSSQGAVIASFDVPQMTIPAPIYACNDGLDNDNDGAVDMADAGCTSTQDNDEYNQIVLPTIVATTNGATNITTSSATLNGYGIIPSNQAVTRYFQWGTSSSNLNNTTNIGSDIYAAGGAYSKTVSGLNDNETYYFRYVVQGDFGIRYGAVKSFNTTYDNVNTVSVSTEGANNINQTSATLEGEFDFDSGRGNINTYFQYGLTTSLGYTTSWQRFNNDRAGNFDATINGLTANSRYYYRACGVSNGNLTCGSTMSLVTDGIAQQLSVVTLPPTNVGQTTAILNGSFANSDNIASVHYEWGTTSSLGNRTHTINRSGNFGSIQQSISGLTPNKRYYYRVVAESNGVRTTGNILNFATIADKGGPTPPKPPKPPVVINTDGSLIRLFIENNRDEMFLGETIVYEIDYENISDVDLEDIVIRVELPKELRFERTTDGSYSKDNNSVTVEVDELDAGEDDSFEITVRVGRGANIGELLVASAVLAYENPTANQALENAIAFDADPFQDNGNGFGASIFGAGFFPATFVGWLILILIIMLVVLASRALYKNMKQRDDETEVSPQEYRPYRPTQKS